MYGYLYCENGGLERLPNDVGFVSNLSINAENLFFFLIFLIFLKPYMRVQDQAYMRMHHGCARTPRASLALLFQK